MDFVLDLPQASSGEGFQISFEQMAFLGTGPLCRERERGREGDQNKISKTDRPSTLSFPSGFGECYAIQQLPHGELA